MAKEFTAPKVGDKINVVLPEGPKVNQSVPAQVVKVSPDGRVIDARVISEEKNPPVIKNAPFYDKEANAKKVRGNTWHFAALMLLLSLVFTTASQAADYTTRGGTAGALSTVAFEGRSSQQCVLTSYDVITDAATSQLRFILGNTPLTLASNATTSSTNVWLTTAAHGVLVGDRIIVQTSESAGVLVVNSTNAASVGFTATVPLAQTAGDSVWLASTNTSVMATGTNRLAGFAIIAAKNRAPLAIEVSGSAAAKVNTATVKYE